jgi:probable HAF family extracellular repeat protein
MRLFNYVSVYFIAICFCAFNSITYAEAPKYRFVDLGLQESDQSEALAINDNGLIAGTYQMLGEKYYFLWQENKGITLIDLPVSASIIVLNNMGQIAGNYKDDNGKERGFIWDPYCGFYDIGTLGGNFTKVYDMNDFGQIVGESESSNISLVDDRNEQHAFLWQCGFMLDLGALTGDLGVLGDRSVATSINDHGQIIGTSNSLIAHKRKFLREPNRAVVWQNGIIEDIDHTLEHKHPAWSFSVNNNGLATYYNTLQGCFSVDLATLDKTMNPLYKKFIISDFGDMYFHSQNFNGNPGV